MKKFGENWKLVFRRNKATVISYIFCLGFIIAAALVDKKFLSNMNLRNLARNVAPMIIVAFAQTMALLMGGIDLSIGAIMSLTNVICATMMTDSSGSVFLAIGASLAVGAVLGLINGILITKGNLQPIILTTATSISINGLALFVLKAPGGRTNKAFYNFVIRGAANAMPMLIALFLMIVLAILLKKTRFGRRVYAVGGSQSSATACGINVAQVKILVFMIVGILAAIGGIYLNALISSGDPLCGANYTQRSIVAAALGGTSLSGGKGGVIGCIAGGLILIIINNILNLMGITSWYQYIIQACLLVLAVVISNFQSGREEN